MRFGYSFVVADMLCDSSVACKSGKGFLVSLSSVSFVVIGWCSDDIFKVGDIYKAKISFSFYDSHWGLPVLNIAD